MTEELGVADPGDGLSIGVKPHTVVAVGRDTAGVVLAGLDAFDDGPGNVEGVFYVESVGLGGFNGENRAVFLGDEHAVLA